MSFYPYLASDNSKISLVFELQEAASATLSNIILMRDGIGCLEKISLYEIKQTKLDEAV